MTTEYKAMLRQKYTDFRLEFYSYNRTPEYPVYPYIEAISKLIIAFSNVQRAIDNSWISDPEKVRQVLKPLLDCYGIQ